MPDTDAVPWFNVNVDAVSVEGSIPSLNVAVTIALMDTPVASLAGDVDVTVGAAPEGPVPDSKM
jgi:hypothetical protein